MTFFMFEINIPNEYGKMASVIEILNSLVQMLIKKFIEKLKYSIWAPQIATLVKSCGEPIQP